MKKFLITLSIVTVLAFGIYFMVGLFNAKPPLPMISIGDKKIEVAQGSHCWDGLFNSICADTISPPELIVHHKMKPVIVSPESEVKIEFKEQPNDNTMGVNRWLTENKVVTVPVQHNILTAPKEQGVYVYDVHARWDKGDVAYVFVIEVQHQKK